MRRFFDSRRASAQVRAGGRAWALALALGLAAMAPTVIAWAQESKATPPKATPPKATPPEPIAELPGFFDFEALELFEKDELAIHISVKGALLQMVARSAKDDPELSGALSGLRGIDVRVYDVAEERRDEVSEILDRTARALGKDGWQPAITVKVKREQGYAFLHYAGKGELTLPEGLAALYLTDDNQVVFVNIVGELDTATISRLARRFELDLLTVEPE